MNKHEIQERLEATLARYIAMPTMPHDIPACTAAIQAIAAELSSVGMFTHIGGPMHPWVVATTTQDALEKKRVKILIVIHFDVVAPDNEEQFVLRVTDHKLVGRGVYDMKFAAACAVEVARDLHSSGQLANYDMGLLFTTDEEMGGYDGALECLQEGWRCDLAIVPDGGTSWGLESRSKSLAYIYLVAPGVSAHSSRPWDGDNPIHKLAPAIQEITAAFENKDRAAVTVSMNSMQTSGGDAPNTTRIPDWARLGISVRAYTAQETDSAVATIADIAKKHGVEMQITINDAAVHLEQNNPLVQTFKHTMQEVHGAPIALVDASAASDARHFAGFNIPSVVTYIDGGGYHGPEEWIKRSDLYKFYNLLQRFLQITAYTPAEATTRTLTTTR